MTSTTVFDPETMDAVDAAEMTGASDLLQTIHTMAEAAMDVVADTRILRPTVYDNEVRLIATTNGQDLPLLIQPAAHRQLAEKTGIPWSYYERMLLANPQLLATNLAQWFQQEPGRHMLRLLRPITDAQHRQAEASGHAYAFVRAVVSSRYRTLDNAAMLNVLLPEAAARNLRLDDSSLTDTRLSLRFVGPERSLDEIAASHALQGTVLRRGEVMSHGVYIRNSETGHASYAIEPFARILACLNGMIVAQSFRAIHVGRDKDDGEVSLQTQRLEDAAVFARSRDRFREVTDESRLLSTGVAIVNGMNTPLFESTEAPSVFEIVERVGMSMRLNGAEQKVLQSELLNDLLLNEGATPVVTRFNVSQALTATARVGYDADGDDDRRTELQRLGWQVLTDPIDQLLKAGAAK